jgi:hypothetical protein
MGTTAMKGTPEYPLNRRLGEPSQPDWAFCSTDESLASVGFRIMDKLARSAVTVLTMLVLSSEQQQSTYCSILFYSIDMCRMRRFLAVLRSSFHSSLS